MGKHGDAPRTLAERLRQRIDEEGPVTFAAYMEAALYDPEEGFYVRHDVGELGEFLTSPHVSAAFGLLISRQLIEFWELMGKPEPFNVIEAGSGDGTLASQIIQSIEQQLGKTFPYWAVDRSAAAREKAASSGLTVAEGLDEVPAGSAGCVLANELLDNLPFHRLRMGKDGLREFFVAMQGGSFTLVEGPVSSDELAPLAARLERGQEAVVRPAALAFLDEAASRLSKGYLLLFDYGWGSGNDDISVHGYRAHRLEEDVLEAPGSRDITAGVDFGALAAYARTRGWQVWGPMTQRSALLALGYRDVDAAGLTRQVEALSDRRGTDALRAFDERNRAGLLIRRGGLGDFLVLCIGVGGVPAPVMLSAVDVADYEEDAAQDRDEVGHQRSR